MQAIKHSPVVFLLALIVAIAMVCISEGAYWQSTESLHQLDESERTMTHILRLQQSIVDAESEQRAYLLTGRKVYLDPYVVALRKIDAALLFLNEQYRNQTEALSMLKQLQTMTHMRLSELDLTIRLYEKGERETAAEIVMNDFDKKQMDAIRKLGTELLQYEARHVISGRDDIHRTLFLSRIGVALLSMVSLIALVMYLRQSFALEKQQEEQQRLIQAEHDRLEIEVRDRTAQLTELTYHLQTAREDERNRLARDLHDELGALLTSAKLDAARIKSRLTGTAPEALERLAHLVDTLNRGIALKRRIIEDLRPSTLTHLGLAPTLEILAREFAEQSGIEIHCTLAPVKLSAAAEIMAYRLVQEAITNISKYATSSQVWVNLGSQNGQVEISVRDNGAGFDTTIPIRSGYGLVGMRFRVEAEGGKLMVTSAPGQGTLIRASLPESKEDAS